MLLLEMINGLNAALQDWYEYHPPRSLSCIYPHPTHNEYHVDKRVSSDVNKGHVGRRSAIGAVHWEVGGAEEMAGESDADTVCDT